VASPPFELLDIFSRTVNEVPIGHHQQGDSKPDSDKSAEDGYGASGPGSREEGDEEGSLWPESEREEDIKPRQLLARSPQLSSAFF